MNTSNSVAFNVLLGAAAFVIVIAGLKVAAPMVVQLLLGGFVAILFATALNSLKKRGVPMIVAVVIIMFGLLVLNVLLIAIVGISVNSISQAVPIYQAQLREMTRSLASFLQQFNIQLSTDMLSRILDPKIFITFASDMFAGLGTLMGNASIILFIALFMLLEMGTFPAKLRAITRNPDESLNSAQEIIGNISRYMVIKTILSTVTGVLVFIWLSFLGVDFPLLWGTIAFLFNFIPNIGAILAMIPAIILALIQLGWLPALLVTAGYMAINLTIGTAVEPRLMGRGLGLSPLVVFLSLIFWGWVLGPVGMLLSVLLTMVIKIVLDDSQNTRWLAVMLGSNVNAEAIYLPAVDGAEERSA